MDRSLEKVEECPGNFDTKDAGALIEDEGIEIIEISDDSHTPEVISVNSSLCDSGFTESLNLHCLESVLEWPKEHTSLEGTLRCTCPSHDHIGFEEYLDEILLHRLSIEDKYHVVSCLDNQPEVTPGIRSILVQWLTAVHHELNLCQDTLYLSVNIMDRVLDMMQVSRDCLELLGITCLLVACKQKERTRDQTGTRNLSAMTTFNRDEIAPPEINELLGKCQESYSRQQVKQLEMIVLMVTSFDLMAPTVQQFLEYFSSSCLSTFAEDEEHAQRLRLARAFCRCVLELSLQEYEFCQFKPSLLALCVWKAAIEHLKTYDGNYFPPGLNFTKMQYDLCLAEVHMFLDNFQQTCEDVPSVCAKYMNLYGAA